MIMNVRRAKSNPLVPARPWVPCAGALAGSERGSFGEPAHPVTGRSGQRSVEVSGWARALPLSMGHSGAGPSFPSL